MARTIRACICGSIFVAAILATTTAAANAQVESAQCAGRDATIDEVVSPTDDGLQVVIEGTNGPDVIVVNATGPTHVDGLGGDDTICIDGVLTITGGEGDDTIYVIGGPIEPRLVVLGGPGDDEIHGGDNLNCCDNDGYYVEIIAGEGGDDTIFGNNGSDYILGMDGDDTIYGNAGADRIFGGGGADAIYGGWGADALFGGDISTEHEPDGTSDTPDEADIVYGGPGDDYLAGRFGADELRGGDGNDILVANLNQSLDDLDASTQPGNVDTAGSRMFGGPGDDLVVGSNRWDRMQGGPGNDTMWGFEGRDYMRGGPGNDLIIGGDGIDSVNGNTGNDHLIYRGSDELNGGWGIDTCEAEVWPDNPVIQSCRRAGAPELSYAPPVVYEQLASLQASMGTPISRHSLRVGDCIWGEIRRPELVETVNKIDCESEHRYEVYREALIAETNQPFNEQGVAAYANDVCRRSLATYIPPDDGRDIRHVALIPTEATWSRAVDPHRIVTCLLFKGDGTLFVDGRAA